MGRRTAGWRGLAACTIVFWKMVVNDLVQQFEDLRLTRWQFRRSVRDEPFRCITCWHAFDAKHELRKHLLNDRNHLYDKQQLKDEKASLMARVGVETWDEIANKMVELTRAQDETARVVLLKLALLISLNGAHRRRQGN